MATLFQYLRIVWARKWIALIVFLLVASAGVAWTLLRAQLYTAKASLIVEMRIDPALGALAPALAAPSYMATQVEVLKSERVASRAVKILGVERSPAAVAQWREATKAKIPLDRYFADILTKGLVIEPSNGSNVIDVSFTSPDPIFAQSAANAFVQAYTDVSVELRIAPARQSAGFLEDQMKTLRGNLEMAQSQLSKFQQSKGIVASDERLDQENARYGTLLSQLAAAQAEQVETSTRQRYSGSETSPDVLASGAVATLKGQIASAETKLTEISAIVGKNHPSRIQLEAQIAELRRQLAAEVRRVAGGASNTSRGSGQKVAELRALSDQQKKTVLALRADRDQIAVYQRDVDVAQRAYDTAAGRLNQMNMEGQNIQANTRLLSPAVEPLEPSRSKTAQGLALSILGALAAAALVVLGLEFINRRVRSVQDLAVIDGVPVLGVLRPAGSRRPVFRRLLLSSGHIPQPPQPYGHMRLGA